jgi:hypothetical protein
VPLGPARDEAAARAAWALVERVQAEVLIVDAASAGPLLAAAVGLGRPWWRGIVWLPSGAPAVPPPAPGFGGWQRLWLACGAEGAALEVASP